MPTVGSVCSSVGGMDLGMHWAGFETRWFCEVDPWRRKILAKHWPGVPIYPDLTTLDPAELEPVDVLIGGTPCQDLSVAGKRAGLDGERSGLFWDYVRIRNALDIEWCIWENVAGALSSNNGLDFASVLGAFVGATVDVPSGGWPSAGVATGPWGGCVWRLLNAQHFGVPQRRRRIFVVGHLGGPCPPEVLLESAGGEGDSAASREAWARAAGELAHGTRIPRRHGRPSIPEVGQEDAGPDAVVRSDVAASLSKGSSTKGVSAPGRRQEDDVNLVAHTLQSAHRGVPSAEEAAGHQLVAAPILKRQGKGVDSDVSDGQLVVAHSLTSAGHDASEDGTGRGTPLIPVERERERERERSSGR